MTRTWDGRSEGKRVVAGGGIEAICSVGYWLGNLDLCLVSLIERLAFFCNAALELCF
jgi:hypothetical protein